MSELFEKRIKFGRLLGKLLTWLTQQNQLFSVEEVKRSKEQAQVNAASGAGISNSLHLNGLAVDINLFKPDGSYCDKVEDYKAAGMFWKSLDPDCCWGGDFKKANGLPKPDADHFSITYQGVK